MSVISFEPHGYQDAAMQFLRDHPEASLLAMEMGLGKTVVTATVIADWLGAVDVRRVLIVAPKRVANHTWPAEFKKWAHLKHLRVAYLTGNREQRMRALRQDADIWVISRDLLKWLASGYINAKMRWPFDCVIVDESTGFKNRDSVRWLALRWARPHINRIVLLTGTPITNSYMDLWAQVYLLDRGKRLFPTITAFRDYCFVENHDGTQYEIRGPEDRQWILDRVKDIVLPMRATDWLDMPELVTIDVPVYLPPAALKRYKELAKKYVAEFGPIDRKVSAVTAAVLVNKLAQIANGFIYDADGAAIHVHDAKLEAMDDLLEGLVGTPVMVVYNFAADLAALKKRFPHGRNVTEKGAIDAWNRGEIPVMWLHSQSAGHGLNLQDGGHHIIWYGPTYSLEQYLQTIARLYRQGQTSKRVICHRLLAHDTIDHGILAILEGKHSGLADLMVTLIQKRG